MFACWLASWLAGLFACLLAGWVADRLAGWLAGWLAGLLFACLLACSLARCLLAGASSLLILTPPHPSRLRVYSLTVGPPEGGWRQSEVDLQNGGREVHELARPAGMMNHIMIQRQKIFCNNTAEYLPWYLVCIYLYRCSTPLVLQNQPSMVDNLRYICCRYINPGIL